MRLHCSLWAALLWPGDGRARAGDGGSPRPELHTVSGTSLASLWERGVTETPELKKAACGAGLPLALTPTQPQPLRGSLSVSQCCRGTVP